ncbi:MAG: EAL domain-containing protein, partial [Acholeplasmataceae bacterium]|nr:EAL domain-containing protein [Acholeplasmataceae bacterium]
LSQEACCISRIENRAFSIVIHNVKNVEQVENFIDKINDAFSIPIQPTKGRKLFITTAIGVSIYPDDGKDAETLLKNADLAGYEAKQSDNKVVFFSNQLTNRIAENIILTNRLFTALDNNEFSLEFQPQINGKTGKTAGVEALLRWNYETNRRIRPDIFIPILEQTGLIHEVGLWVLEQSLKEHNKLISKGFAPLRFSINISIIQFRDDDFVSETINLIKKYKVDPKYIELEITETLLSVNFEDTVAKLEKLKDFGVSIAIDDFGKGYSSLHRLEIVPFNRIKIDKSIVDDIISKKKKTVIVQTIVTLAKSLMADTTAEGVETKEQLDFLVDMDCDEIQGYYYSRPLPIEALEIFLKNEKI